MININDINYKVRDRIIFDNASLSLKSNCLYFIIGENGIGKSTLLTFLTKYFITKKVFLDDKLIKRADIFHQSSERIFLPRIKGEEYLDFREELLLTDNTKHYKSFEKIFNIDLKNYINEYSTGMKRKIEFIPSLFKKYNIYIFDEPFSGLDFESKEIVKDLINSFRREDSIILISTHDLDYVDNSKYKKIYLIENEKIYRKTDTSDLKEKIKNKMDYNIKKILE